VHTLFGPLLPPAPAPSLFWPFSPILLKRRHKQQWERQSIFASWDDSYTERFLALLPCTSVLQPKLIHLYLTFSLLPGHLPILTSRCFKFSVLAALQWGHQTLPSFGFPTYPHTSCMCSPLSVQPKSNNIAAFALDLKSTYDGEHMIFGLLSLANLAQNDVLQFHPFTWEW
jgi:hypothetical protein